MRSKKNSKIFWLKNIRPFPSAALRWVPQRKRGMQAESHLARTVEKDIKASQRGGGNERSGQNSFDTESLGLMIRAKLRPRRTGRFFR